MSNAEMIKDELITLCPDFTSALDDESDFLIREDGSFSVHGVFAVFSHYIANRLARESDPSLGKVFEYVESKLTGDDSEIENAACTCFLENLMNRVSEIIPPQHFVPLLGSKSRRFCRAYDEWCGTKTDGL